MYRAHHAFEPEQEEDIQLHRGDILSNVEYVGKYFTQTHNPVTAAMSPKPCQLPLSHYQLY